ncbi:MAG: hypothetical protein GXY14_02635 [Spirochaetes bacterium]|nr:hypothetical protein [Spirochaetota bacterium]
MDAIYLIGDSDTVNAFRVCGIEGFRSDPDSSQQTLGELLARDDASVILVTRECAVPLQETINRVNRESGKRVILEIPGMADAPGMGRSLTGYITEALGVAL